MEEIMLRTADVQQRMNEAELKMRKAIASRDKVGVLIFASEIGIYIDILEGKV